MLYASAKYANIGHGCCPRMRSRISRQKNAWWMISRTKILPRGFARRLLTCELEFDVASLTLKKQANTIVLVAGDSDFVPAAKLARREGEEMEYPESE